MKKMNNKGFSLVELIVVIAIMAVLVGVLAPQFIKYVESSRRSTDVSNAQNIQSAILADCADPTTTSTYSGTSSGSISTGKLPSTMAEAPKLKGKPAKDGDFYAEWNATDGTCKVYESSLKKYDLTSDSGVFDYKNAAD